MSSKRSNEIDVDREALSGPVVDRRTTVKLLGVAGMAGLAGCAGGGGGDPETTAGDGDGEETEEETEAETEEESETSSDVSGGRLQAGWFTGSIDTLDPPYISVGQYFQVAANVFSGLVTLTEDLTIRGDLASDWEVKDGGATITFDLREGVTFHNGDAFDAEDVRYTINRTLSEETPAASKLSTLKPVDDGGVVVEDDYRVTLGFEKAMAPALIYLTRGPGRAATIVSRGAIEEMGKDAYTTTPVGTGPFQVTEHEVGSSLTLDAYDDYFETDEDGTALPYLDGVDVRPIPEAATIVNALRSGDIDFANLVPLQNLGRVEEASGVTADEAPGVNWYGLAMNETKEIFSSRDARVGIAKVIDNERFVETAYFGNALPDNGPINRATNWVWREDKPDTQNYAPEEGKQMIEDAGIDGAEFSILVQQGDTRAAKAMRQQLNAAGFEVSLDQVTSSTYWERYQNLDYDTTISGSVGDPDPDQSLWNFYRKPDEGGVWNWVNFVDDQVHQLLEEQRRTLDREERAEVLHELEDRLIDQAPQAYLVHQKDIAAYTDAVSGFTHIPFMRNFHRVSVDR
jgi:peptide/nickel transport system substrate-binding protein